MKKTLKLLAGLSAVAAVGYVGSSVAAPAYAPQCVDVKLVQAGTGFFSDLTVGQGFTVQPNGPYRTVCTTMQKEGNVVLYGRVNTPSGTVCAGTALVRAFIDPSTRQGPALATGVYVVDMGNVQKGPCAGQQMAADLQGSSTGGYTVKFSLR